MSPTSWIVVLAFLGPVEDRPGVTRLPDAPAALADDAVITVRPSVPANVEVQDEEPSQAVAADHAEPRRRRTRHRKRRRPVAMDPTSHAAPSPAAERNPWRGRRILRNYDFTYFSFRVQPLPGGPDDPATFEDQREWHRPIDVKFQLGIAFDTIPTRYPFSLEFTYRQVSWWPIGYPSAPFRESNFNPGFRLSFRPAELCWSGELSCGKIRYRTSIGGYRQTWDLVLDEVALGFEHTSDGEGIRRVDDSRAMNQVYFELRASLQPRLRGSGYRWNGWDGFHLRLKTWATPHSWIESGNWDIVRYIGWGELEMSAGLTFEVRGARAAWYPGARLSMRFRHGTRTCPDESRKDATELEVLGCVDPVRGMGSLRVALHVDLLKFMIAGMTTGVGNPIMGRPRPEVWGFLPKFYVEWFGGYAESMKLYDRAVSRVYVGAAIDY